MLLFQIRFEGIAFGITYSFPSKIQTHSPFSFQAKADPLLRNLDGKAPLDFAQNATVMVLLGDYRKRDLLEAARTGKEDRLSALLTPQNVNCHSDDGRKSTPLHLAAGYNRYDLQFSSFCFFVRPYFMLRCDLSS